MAKTAIDYNQVCRDAIAAADSAKEQNDKDGGTCNLDCVALFCGSRNKTLCAILEGLDQSAFVTRWFGRMCILANFGEGQADLRSRMNESAYAVLKKSGIDCMMYYQMD